MQCVEVTMEKIKTASKTEFSFLKRELKSRLVALLKDLVLKRAQ